MKVKDVTADQLIDAVRKMAALTPDRRYRKVDVGGEIDQQCSYFTSGDDPERGCLIGEAFVLLGVSRSELRLWENDRGSGDTSVPQLLADFGIPVSGESRGWLTAAQSCSDDGDPWGPIPAAIDMVWGDAK